MPIKAEAKFIPLTQFMSRVGGAVAFNAKFLTTSPKQKPRRKNPAGLALKMEG
jgi:hypothetical protein